MLRHGKTALGQGTRTKKSRQVKNNSNRPDFTFKSGRRLFGGVKMVPGEHILGREIKREFGHQILTNSLIYGHVMKFVIDGFGQSANTVVYATRDAVTVKTTGFRISSKKDVNALAQAIVEAYTTHEALKESDGERWFKPHSDNDQQFSKN